jgi:hypothetical protein
MIYRLLLSLTFCTLIAPMVGCGGNTGEAVYDAENAPPVTAEEIQAGKDYEAKMKAEKKAMYGQ